MYKTITEENNNLNNKYRVLKLSEGIFQDKKTSVEEPYQCLKP
jgi:hypothetical protein